MSSDFNFTVTSWFLGNIRVKPYFNTQCPWSAKIWGGGDYCSPCSLPSSDGTFWFEGHRKSMLLTTTVCSFVGDQSSLTLWSEVISQKKNPHDHDFLTTLAAPFFIVGKLLRFIFSELVLCVGLGFTRKFLEKFARLIRTLRSDFTTALAAPFFHCWEAVEIYFQRVSTVCWIGFLHGNF